MSKKTLGVLKKTAFAVIISLITNSIAYGNESEREYLVKAAFLYNFLKFVTWDKNTENNEIKICTIGDPEYLKDIKTIEGKKVHEKAISVPEPQTDNNSNECDVIFLSRYDSHDYTRLIAETQGKGVLTVSDIVGFAEKGGIIEFYTTEDNKVRFKINIRAAEKNGLKISSELLKLAVIVGRGN